MTEKYKNKFPSLIKKFLLALDESIRTTEDLAKLYDIDREQVQFAWDKMVDDGVTLLGGIPSCRIRMIKPWNWEFIANPPMDNQCAPLWEEVSEDKIEHIYGGNTLMMVLLVFAAENGNPSEYINEKWRYQSSYMR